MNLMLSSGIPFFSRVSSMGGRYWLVLVGRVMSSKMMTTSSAPSASLSRGFWPRGFKTASLISAGDRGLASSEFTRQRWTLQSSGKVSLRGWSSYQQWWGISTSINSGDMVSPGI